MNVDFQECMQKLKNVYMQTSGVSGLQSQVTNQQLYTYFTIIIIIIITINNIIIVIVIIITALKIIKIITTIIVSIAD